MKKIDLSKVKTSEEKFEEVKAARERTLQEIRSRWREIITNYTLPAKKKVNGKPTYICPFCGHGKGGDGLKDNPTSKDGNGIICFSCGFSGDIIDLIMKHNGIDYNAALQAAADHLGIDLTPQGARTAPQSSSGDQKDKYTAAALKAPENAAQEAALADWIVDQEQKELEDGTGENNIISLAFAYWNAGQPVPNVLDKWLQKYADYEYTDLQDLFTQNFLLQDGAPTMYADIANKMAAAEIEKIFSDPPAPEIDHTEYYKQCKKTLQDTPDAISYLQARGISLKTANRCQLGFDPVSDPAKAPGAMGDERRPHPAPRIIVPVTKSFYIGRRIDGIKEYAKMNSAGGGSGLFLHGLLKNSPAPVFIVEGAFDSLAVLECGQRAVALNSVSNAGQLIKTLEAVKTPPTLILCLDNDDAGQQANKTIIAGLRRLGIPYIEANIAGNHKDPNEALTADRPAFEKALQEALEKAAAAKVPEDQAPDETPPTNCATEYLTGGAFERDIAYFKAYKDRKTGYPAIDKHLTLYPGLAALGGASSLGKTTFAVNLIDKLLERGETVLYFSLEQLPIEIITKSLARIIREQDPYTPLTNTDIKNGATSEKLEAIKREYAKNAGNYYIFTGDFRTTAADIAKQVEDFRRDHGGDSCRPVVVIDYLQLIAPPADFRGGIREITDENIKTLKDMQKRNELFVLMISNFNRSSNYEPVSYESFKETGMVEYTCDFVWGLQLALLDAENDDFYSIIGTRGGRQERPLDQKRRLVNAAQSKIPKQVEFVSLKNRNGKQFFKAFFDYYPQHDLFVPTDNDGFTTSYGNDPFTTKAANANNTDDEQNVAVSV